MRKLLILLTVFAASAAVAVPAEAGPPPDPIPNPFQAGAFISGTVYAGDTGKPLKDVCVDAHGISSSATATSGPLGKYVLNVPQQRPPYIVFFRDCAKSPRYAGQVWPGREFGSPEEIRFGEFEPAITGINATLHLGGFITGAVTDQLSHDLVDFHNIAVTPEAALSIPPTFAVGAYRLGPLPAGAYKLKFGVEDGRYPTESPLHRWWPNASDEASAADVVVTHGGVTRADEELQQGGTIEGKVTDAQTGEPASACILVTSSPTGRAAQSQTVRSDASGHWSIASVKPGLPLYIDFDAESPSCAGDQPLKLTNWWPNQPETAHAQTITISEPYQVISGVDAQLQRAP